MTDLAGQVVCLTGGSSRFSEGLANALRRAGATVVAGLARGPTAVVHAAIEPAAMEAMPLEEVDDRRFSQIWEKGMRETIESLQFAFRAFERGGGGGRFVLVIPTLGMSGAPGLGPLCALLEGQRLLVKSAARQWGPQGITVNCLAVGAELVLPDGASAYRSDAISLAPAALGGPGDAEGDVGAVLAALLAPGMHFVTGATICADGGVWMSP